MDKNEIHILLLCILHLPIKKKYLLLVVLTFFLIAKIISHQMNYDRKKKMKWN